MYFSIFVKEKHYGGFINDLSKLLGCFIICLCFFVWFLLKGNNIIDAKNSYALLTLKLIVTVDFEG